MIADQNMFMDSLKNLMLTNRTEIERNRADIETLKQKVDDLEAKDRLNKLIISGSSLLPLLNETPISPDRLSSILNKDLNSNIDSNIISRVSRLGKSRILIVTLKDAADRKHFFSAFSNGKKRRCLMH